MPNIVPGLAARLKELNTRMLLGLVPAVARPAGGMHVWSTLLIQHPHRAVGFAFLRAPFRVGKDEVGGKPAGYARAREVVVPAATRVIGSAHCLHASRRGRAVVTLLGPDSAAVDIDPPRPMLQHVGGDRLLGERLADEEPVLTGGF